MDASQKSYGDQLLNTVFSSEQHHLIYIYDFLNLWTFFVELMEVGESNTGTTYPNLINAQGEVPEEAPEKLFESDDFDSSEDEDFDEGEDFDEEEDYDEADFY
jgi:hypothetical protein